MKKITCKNILMKRQKKSQLEIYMKFMHTNKFTCHIHKCTNLLFFKIFSKNYFFSIENTCKQVFIHVYTGPLSKIYFKFFCVIKT